MHPMSFELNGIEYWLHTFLACTEKNATWTATFRVYKLKERIWLRLHCCFDTGFLSEIGTKLRDWAVGQAGGSCYSQAALSSNDSKML